LPELTSASFFNKLTSLFNRLGPLLHKQMYAFRQKRFWQDGKLSMRSLHQHMVAGKAMGPLSIIGSPDR
jgi:hypothetical protein